MDTHTINKLREIGLPVKMESNNNNNVFFFWFTIFLFAQQVILQLKQLDASLEFTRQPPRPLIFTHHNGPESQPQQVSLSLPLALLISIYKLYTDREPGF